MRAKLEVQLLELLLSTPSLGITSSLSTRRDRLRGELSTPSLGITRQIGAPDARAGPSFQLPLSGSRKRDVAAGNADRARRFQLPLSGSQNRKLS